MRAVGCSKAGCSKKGVIWLIKCLLWFSLTLARAYGDDLSVAQEFLVKAFGKELPAIQMLTFKPTEKRELETILQHPLTFQRLRYWQRGDDSVWILDEIGKHKPITAGFWLQKGFIKEARVLVFRENRGWEIKHPRFLVQYAGLYQVNNNQLSAQIDGISGATLSVRAMNKMARMALYLDKHRRESTIPLPIKTSPNY